MKFAFFTHQPWPEGTDAKEVIDRSAEQVLFAEELGFYSAWLAEHHFTRYSIGSSSLILATNLAAQTKSIRLGTAVLVLLRCDSLAEYTNMMATGSSRLDRYGRCGYDLAGINLRGKAIGHSARHQAWAAHLPVPAVQEEAGRGRLA